MVLQVLTRNDLERDRHVFGGLFALLGGYDDFLNLGIRRNDDAHGSENGSRTE